MEDNKWEVRLALVNRLEKLHAAAGGGGRPTTGGVSININTGGGNTWLYVIIGIIVVYWWYTGGFAREGFQIPCRNSMYQPMQAYPYAVPSYYNNPQLMPFAYPTLPYKHQYTDNLAREYLTERMGMIQQRY